MNVAMEMNLDIHRLDCCPKKYLWPSVHALFHNPVFAAALRYQKLPLAGGGVLNQPANISQMIAMVRSEMETIAHFEGSVRAQRRALGQKSAKAQANG